MRRRIAMAACVFLLSCGLILGGCGEKNKVVNYDDETGDIVDITFFGNKYEPENVAVIEEIISDFMKENPDIRVSYESLKGSEYFEALEKRMAAEKGADVFMVNHDVVLDLAADGKLADLSGLKTISGYTGLMLDQMDEDGKIYWVPTTVSVFGLYCNMDLLEENGQKVPDNLNEWVQVLDYFKGKGMTPVIANNDISLKTLAIGRGFYEVYQEGRENEVFESLNAEEESLSTYLSSGFSLAEEFVRKGYIDAQAALHTEKTSDDLEQFVKGESPFMLTGAWAAGRVKMMEPNLSFQVVPYPLLDDGPLVVINAGTRLSVNADSEHVEEAERFVEYFTGADNIQKFADQQASFSPLKEGSPSSVEEIRPLIPCYQSGRTVLGADGKLDMPIWKLTAQASVGLLSGEPLDAVMDWMDTQAGQEGSTQE